ncbi:HRSL1 enzyme, partial [Oreocharis arfaki]|nr:HRSL1 enzyme [Oreocharis arfaki]
MAHDKRNPKPGDLIEIDRGIYQHWALYVGDGYVTHVTGSSHKSLSVSSVSNVDGEAKVKKEHLKEVVGNNEWRVNNKYDRSRTPLPVEDVIQRAERSIGREVQYSPIGNNCEHFVTELRYGRPLSDQVSAA